MFESLKMILKAVFGKNSKNFLKMSKIIQYIEQRTGCRRKSEENNLSLIFLRCKEQVLV